MASSWMIAYFDVWSPFRDGIRMVEKKVRLEVPEAQVEIADLIDQGDPPALRGAVKGS
ncbi:hypothetical protein [Hyalangium sp.]|uniref:hypothetical protein n=1 Tax=Hyalangium sp. TaxID=2028555 RepID=UPI002D718A58|nr:hypothetical protein [Hyalangium sp.]HYH95029.1 hypothetical protein [Hyalangium sp.]